MNSILAKTGCLAISSTSRPRRAGRCVACLDARDPAAWRAVGGLTPVQRLVRSLELEGVGEIVVLSSVAREPSRFGTLRLATRVRLERLAPDAPLSDALRQISAPEGVLLADARLLVDRRLLGALLRAGQPVIAWPTPQRPGEAARVRLARLDPARLELLHGPLQPPRDVAYLDPRTLPLHVEEMRGPVPILLRDVSSPEAAALAETALVRSTQKHAMDAPARWIDPLPEDWLLRRLAPTRVTPDQVTIAGVALGTLAAWLLWKGWLWAALPSMLLVGWLDGVDGKLARLRLHFSRLGAAESLLDFAVENVWWIALTAHLASAHGGSAVLAGAALVGGNLADEVAYTIGHARLGRALDLLSPADRAFRLVARRRNIYVWILCVAAPVGSVREGFVACGVWAVATAAVHGVRLAWALHRARPAGPRP